MLSAARGLMELVFNPGIPTPSGRRWAGVLRGLSNTLHCQGGEAGLSWIWKGVERVETECR